LFSFKAFHIVPKSEWEQLDGLSTKGLITVFKYFDGQTDDELLTQAVLASAQSMQAHIEFSASVTSIDVEAKQCILKYTQEGQEKIVHSTTVVNATGPWINLVLKRIQSIPTPQPEIDLVQGTHIVIANPTKKRQGIYYLEALQDKRAIFVMPWKENQLLIGTTENQYKANPADVIPLECEVKYLLSVYNYYFNEKLTKKSVLSRFAGLRVLPKMQGNAFSRPRDTLIVPTDTANPRLLSLYGGKLTAYRSTADQVMKKLTTVLPKVKGFKAMNTRYIDLRN
jgi:glycerol-3-phosphate dehydrogenase